MNKEGKERQSNLVSHGTKARISPIVSQLFRSIGSEMTEMVCIKVPGSEAGQMVARLVSKAEAMVRDLYEKAMPTEDEVDAKIQMDARKLILGYTIDKNAKETSKESVPDRVSELNKERLNKLALGNTSEKPDGAKTKTKESKKPKVPTIPVCVLEREKPKV